jgi:hypothetical protein
MSELNIIDSSKNLFSIDKKVIVFEITNEKKNTLSNININISNSSSHYALYISHTSIIVTNLTSEYLSLRTKTTKKKNYNVYPSYCILSPNSEKKIDFKYFINEGEKISNSGHKFKFEGFIISNEEKDIDSKILFNKYISQKIPVKASLIKASVEFIEKENNTEINDININNSKNNIIDNSITIKNDIINNDTNNNINNNSNIILFNTNNNINNIIDITEEKIKEDNENNNEKENIIDTKENNNIDYKQMNYFFRPNNKNINKIINKSSVNIIDDKEKNYKSTYGNKNSKNSYNDFGTPIKKRKNEDFENMKTEEEKNAILSNLKVEYYKLKNELDNLIERYYNLKNHVDLEEENKDINIEEENIKNKYTEKKKQEIKLPQHICMGLFILAILLGFYLS